MKFYRYEARETSSVDEFGDVIVPNPRVYLHTYNLHKETPKGYWIGFGHYCPDRLRGNSIWVSKTARKRYAYPTKEEALLSFIRRKEKQVKILKYQAWSAEIALNEAKKLTMCSQKFTAGDEVRLPFHEKGEIIEFIDLPWASRYNVRITESNGFNEIGEIVDFFEKDLKEL